MRRWLSRLLWGVVALFLLAGVAFFTVVAGRVDRALNTVTTRGPYSASATAATLHASSLVADLHADALLWARDPRALHDFGHVDLPRLRRGNVAIQVFSAVTKTPRGINYERNSADTDNITLLAVAQRWPIRTWGSLLARAQWQAERLHRAAAEAKDGGPTLVVVRTAEDLARALAQPPRQRPIAALLATEGLHPLEGRLEHVDTLFAHGYRIFGLTHFFDNEVGGSAHGMEKGGLTAFGRQVIAGIDARGGVIDLAHASPALFRDVLQATSRPVLVSHTGVQGTCAGPRNLSDDQLRHVAARGGVVGIGFWDGAICDPTPTAFARAVAYAIRVAGEDHVAIGSDFDGSTRTPFDATGLPQATEALMLAGLTPEQIRKVLGENVARFLRATLPPR